MASVIFDLATTPLRQLNQYLHGTLDAEANVVVRNPDGAHNIAVGVDAPVSIEIQGHAGYYAAGMNKQARVVIDGIESWRNRQLAKFYL